jgi:hypothetical protein
LLLNGYGRRPDPTLHPDHYAIWLRAALQPGTVVSGPGLLGDSSNNPNSNPSFSGNWSGPIDSNDGVQADRFNDSWAYFHVPQAYAESGAFNYTHASTWAGLGGTGSEILWQAGVEEWTQNYFYAQASYYQTWWQLAPMQSTQNNLYNVNNGDYSYNEVWVCDKTTLEDTQPYTANAILCAEVDDYSIPMYWFSNPGVYGGVDYSCAPGGVCSQANFGTTEVIQEWPSSQSYGYAQFNKFGFLEAGGCAWIAGCFNIGTSDDPELTTMSQIGSPSHVIGGSCMADNSGNCNGQPLAPWVWWNSHN